MTSVTPTSSGYAVVQVNLPIGMMYHHLVQSSSLRASADLTDPTLLASRSLLASIMSDASSASLMDWGWMEPGPPWPPAGTAKAAGGGSSFEKSIRGRPGVEGTPAAQCQDVGKERKGKERKGKERKGKETPFNVNSLRSQVLYWAAQAKM